MTVENTRRHGHSDPRFRTRRHLHLVVDGDMHDSAISPPPELGSPESQADDLSVWEGEGGLSAVPEAGGEDAAPALDWDAFKELVHVRGRHDLDAVKAYADYRATGHRPGALAVAH